MRLKYSDNSNSWNEDNSAIVDNKITIRQHAQQTVDRYNKNPKLGKKRIVLILVRNLPKKYIRPIEFTKDGL
jgi:hypothetical protein